MGPTWEETEPVAVEKKGQLPAPTWEDTIDPEEKYGTTGQQIITGIEGAARGVIGPIAPAIERGLGIDPEDIRMREETNPITAGASEALGFGAGMLTGTGEAALLSKAGEAVSGALKLGESTSLASRMAAGAAKASTELSLLQASDEATKAIVEDPDQSIGSAAANIGLAGILGGAMGPAFVGLGSVAKSGLDKVGLKEFADRLAYRGANANPNEAIQHELENAYKAYHEMGSEISGSSGVKSQAIESIIPEINENIIGSAKNTSELIRKKIDFMKSKPNIYPERLVTKLENDLAVYNEKALPKMVRGGIEELQTGIPEIAQPEVRGSVIHIEENPNASMFPWLPREFKKPIIKRGEEQIFQHELRNPDARQAVTMRGVRFENPSSKAVFDAQNELKQTLQSYSKGNFGPFSIPVHHEAYDFLNATKSLGSEIRSSLENPEIWGKEVTSLQKNLNEAWSSAIPAVKDIEKKFMTKVGNELVLDPAKFQTYMTQNGKATSTTVRQQMVGKFVDAIEKFSKATEEAYEKAGIKNPMSEPTSLGTLKESLNRPSFGARLADMWYDKVGAQALGSGAGAAVGAALAGVPGAFIAKEVLGPVFGAMIQPIVEKTSNISAYQQAMRFGKVVVEGSNKLVKASEELFSTGAKPLLLNSISDDKKIDLLDEKIQKYETEPQKLMNISGDLGHYSPNHAEALSKTAMTAINYLNSERPKPLQISPLDSKIEPSKAQKLEYRRTLSIAQNPLAVIKHINDGTLLPKDIKTLNSVYPSYYKKMSAQLMAAMTDHISKGESIPYKKRQSLSLFLGQPLDSTMMPESIIAAQSVYIPKNQQPQQMQGTKKSTSKLGDIGKNLQTPSQRSEAIRNKG